MIVIANITKIYHGNSTLGDVTALKNVCLSVEDGQIACVVGPSGCGKTTLLNILAGLDEDYEGDVSFTQPDNGKAGYMFQTPSLLPWRTVWDNVTIGCEIAGKSKDFYEPLARELLERYELDLFAKHYPSSLSQGMQQRVSLIRLVLFDARLWLLDEPFSRLDHLLRRELYNDLLTLATERKTTAIVVTHDLEEAVTLGDTVVLLSRRPGTVRAEIQVPVERDKRVSTSEYLPKELHPYLEQVWGTFSTEVAIEGGVRL